MTRGYDVRCDRVNIGNKGSCSINRKARDVEALSSGLLGHSPPNLDCMLQPTTADYATCQEARSDSSASSDAAKLGFLWPWLEDRFAVLVDVLQDDVIATTQLVEFYASVPQVPYFVAMP